MSQGPSVGSVVADRYRLLRILVADPPRRHWLAEDGRERRRVEIVELPLQSVVAWTGAITVEHAGLATLHATLTCHGGSFGVFEQIAGQSLAERIAAGRAFDRGTVFSTVIALADAVAHLHAAGVAHGSISPESVLFRDATAEQPLLSYRGPLPPGSPYRPPEETATLVVDREHDIWSLAALLFLLETGRLPPATGIYSEADLSAAGIDDELLGGVLAQGLAADPSRRSRRLKSLIHPLRVWLQRHDPRTLSRGASSLRALGLSKVEDDPHAPSIEVRRAPLSEPPPEGPSLELGETFASEPPPRPSEAPLIEVSESMMPETEESPELLVPSTSTPPAVSPVAASRGSRRWLPIAAGLAAGAGAVFLIALGARPPQPTEEPPAPTPTPARSSPAAPEATTPPPPASAPPPKPGPVHRVAHETTAACVERHLPEGSFPTSPDMDFLCMTHDPREGDHLMRAALVNAAKGQAVTPAMRMWSGLTWYGMAGFAALRAGCCPDAPAIELPEPGTNCKALGPLLDALGRATVEDESVDATLADIRTTIGCEIENRRSVVFWRKDSPGGAEPTTLRGLLDHVRNPRPPAEK